MYELDLLFWTVHLSIGDHSSISLGVLFLRCGDVRIGAHVDVGPCNIFRGGESIELSDYCQLLRLNTINAIPDNDCVNAPRFNFYLGLRFRDHGRTSYRFYRSGHDRTLHDDREQKFFDLDT